MAMNTWLQMVSAAELDALEKAPASINALDKPSDQTYSTYYPCSINYFLLGTAYPDGEDPLGTMLFGAATIDCATLENGNFGIVPPGKVAAIAEKLAKLDLKKLAKSVEDADADELADQEVDDFEILAEDDEPSKTLVGAVKALATFYQRAADTKVGIVMYTT